MTRKMFLAVAAGISGGILFTATAMAGPALSTSGLQTLQLLGDNSGTVQKVHRRNKRHCHGKGKKRRCHGPHKPRGSYKGSNSG